MVGNLKRELTSKKLNYQLILVFFVNIFYTEIIRVVFVLINNVVWQYDRNISWDSSGYTFFIYNFSCLWFIITFDWLKIFIHSFAVFNLGALHWILKLNLSAYLSRELALKKKWKGFLWKWFYWKLCFSACLPYRINT